MDKFENFITQFSKVNQVEKNGSLGVSNWEINLWPETKSKLLVNVVIK